MKITTKFLVCPFLMLQAANALAEKNNTNGVDFDLYALTKLSDNALRRPDGEIEERQDIYRAAITARYTGEWAYLRSSYEASRHLFEKDSQIDRNILEGDTELRLGNDYQPLSLLLTHSRRSLLNQPDAIDLLRNRDEREILGAQPMLKWKLNPSDALILGATYSEISYKTAIAQDSKVEGVNLRWQLGLTKVDTLSFIVQQNEVTFDYVPELDYRHQGAFASYAVQLNNLDYSLTLGGARVIFDADEDDMVRPSFDIAVNYHSGYNLFKFIANRQITNTSMGNGNNLGLGDSLSDALTNNVDLIDLRRAEFTWATTAICERCNFNLSAFDTDQNYQKSNQSFTEKGLGAGFNYKFTRAASAYVNAARSKRTFDPDSLRNDYTVDRVKIGLMYKFNNDLVISIFHAEEKRDSVLLSENYVEHFTGLSLSYSF